jgi:hypothetical protein
MYQQQQQQQIPCPLALYFLWCLVVFSALEYKVMIYFNNCCFYWFDLALLTTPKKTAESLKLNRHCLLASWIRIMVYSVCVAVWADLFATATSLTADMLLQ